LDTVHIVFFPEHPKARWSGQLVDFLGIVRFFGDCQSDCRKAHITKRSHDLCWGTLDKHA